ncbi:MAG: undecaprenyl-diphosphate phosphatase [Bacillota bacterium]|nr:undecaprenyl-diphosphate phosphatase [Bacillota bacterium]
MTIWQAVILGLVQGLGEFLPISSSAHLVLLPWFFGWSYQGLTVDVALHLGTLVAVVAYFWRDWLDLLLGALKWLKGVQTLEGRLFWYLLLASLPGAALGYLLESWAETVFRTPVLVGSMLIILGLVLYWADRKGTKGKEINQVGLLESIIIGFSQAAAIIPGVSRSGITMTAGLLTGLTREGAARFSFLLSVPIIFGAGVLKVPDLMAHPEMVNLPFLVGVFVSAVTGIASIGFLLRYVKTRNYLPFVWYRVLLGALIFFLVFLRS